LEVKSRKIKVEFIRQVQDELQRHGAFLGNRKATILGGLLGDLDYLEGTAPSIPTMVTPRELRLLANFFAARETAGSVLEIGPYLGGSTQAIGYGLVASGFSGTFHVVDTFQWSDPGFKTRLREDFEALGGDHRLGKAAAEAVDQGDWYPLFNEVHRGAPYGTLVKPHRWRLPQEAGSDAQLPFLEPKEVVGALFIDAFKRWDTTFHGMKMIAPHLREGSIVIFQDFSWVDCYWLPILVSILSERMNLVAKVDNTAILRVVAPFGTEELDAFGPAPDPAKFETYSETLRNWALAQFHSGDEVGFLCHSAQRYVLCHAMRRGPEAADQFVFLRDFCRRLNATWLSDMLTNSSFEIPAA